MRVGKNPGKKIEGGTQGEKGHNCPAVCTVPCFTDIEKKAFPPLGLSNKCVLFLIVF